MQADVQSKADRSRRSYELHFPRDLTHQAVVDFLRSLAGLTVPVTLAITGKPSIAFEIEADVKGIHHHLAVPRHLADYVVSQLRGQLPGVRLTLEQRQPQRRFHRAVELGLTSQQVPLRIGSAEAVTTTILGSLHPLVEGQSVLLQWIVIPARAERPRPDDKAHAAKHADHIFHAVGRIAANGIDQDDASRLIHRTYLALASIRSFGVTFKYLRISDGRLNKRVVQGTTPFEMHCLLNTSELATLIAFPIGNPQLPGLPMGRSRHLPADAAIPDQGIVFGLSNFPGAERPLALTPLDFTRNLHILGPTGTGKSTLELNLSTQFIQQGYGMALFDPKGDLVADVLDRIPYQRIKDVVLLDPTDTEYPIGFNPLQGPDPYLVSDQILGVFDKLYDIAKMPRTGDVLRSSVLTLAQQGLTLLDISSLLSSAAFRREVMSKTTDVVLQNFWHWYDGLKDAQQGEIIGPVMRRIRPFELRPSLRAMIGQSSSGVDLIDVINSGKILLVSLPKGVLSEETSSLFGSLLMTKLWEAAMTRSAIPVADRKPFFCVVDEMQDFLNLPHSINEVLAQARGYGFPFIMAHQEMGQLPGRLKDAVLANARSRVVFQTSYSDAATLERELSPYLKREDLQALGPYEAVLHLSTAQGVVPPATGMTLPPPPALGSTRAARAASRATHGRPMAEVEQEIAQRYRRSEPPKPTIGFDPEAAA